MEIDRNQGLFEAAQAVGHGSRGAIKRTHSELFLQELQPTNNLLHDSSRGTVSEKILETCVEWTQVFDLQDAALVVMVKGNQLNFKLVHFTEKLLNQFLLLKAKGRVQVPELPQTLAGAGFRRPQSFLLTEDSQRTHLREVFERFSAAKMAVEGMVVPHIVLTRSKVETTTADSNKELGIDSYTLSFVTQLNKLYQIELDAFFLHAGSRTRVHGPFTLDLYGSAKAFDAVKTSHSRVHAYEFIIGTSIPMQGNQDHQVKEAAINQALYTIRGDIQKGFELIQMGTQSSNLVQGIMKGIKGLMGQGGAMAFIAQPKTGQQAANMSIMRGSTEVGVVTVRALSNCLFAVVFTNGFVRIWSAETSRFITEFDLISSSLPINGNPEAQKLVRAKVDYHKRPYAPASDSAMIFELSIAYASQSFETFDLTWKVMQLSLAIGINIRNRPLIDDTNSYLYDLSNEEGAFIAMQRSLSLEKDSDVIELIYDQNVATQHADNNSLWLVNGSLKSKRTKVIDLNNDNQQVWGLDNEIDFQGHFDNPTQIPEEFRNLAGSPFSDDLIRHYIERLMVKDRFRPSSVQTVAKSLYPNVNLSLPLNKDNLREIAQANDGHLTLAEILEKTICYQQANAKISGLSRSLGSGGKFRIIARQQGLSVVKEDSIFSTLQNRVNATCLCLKKAADRDEEKQLKLNKIRQLLPLNYDEESQNADLISSLIGSIKYLHFSQLSFIDSTLTLDASRKLSEIMSTVLSESTSSQALHHEISHLLDLNRDFIESQLTDLIHAIFEYLEKNIVELRKQKLHFEFRGTSYCSSLTFLKLMQRNVQRELTQIYSLIRDILLCRKYIDSYKPALLQSDDEFMSNQLSLVHLEAWLRQLSTLKRVLNQDLDIKTLEKCNLKRRADVENVFKSVEKLIPGEGHNILSYLSTLNFLKSSNLQNQMNGEELFQEDVDNFLGKYTFSISSPSVFPKVAQSLQKIKLYKELNSYLHPLINSDMACFRTLGFEIIQVLVSAHAGFAPSEFPRHLRICSSLFKQANLAELSIPDLVFSPNKEEKRSITASINQLTVRDELKFALLLVLQLKGTDPRYSLFILLGTLTEENLTPNERDLINERIFNTALQIPNQFNYMYEACVNTNNVETRRSLIGQFLLHITGFPRKIQHFKFSHADIDLALEYLVAKVEQELPSKDPSENVTNLFSTVSVVITIAEIYNRQLPIATVLWGLQNKVEVLIRSCGKNQTKSFQDLLHLQSILLQNLFVMATNFEDHLLIVDDTSVTKPSSKKPIDDEFIQKKRGRIDLKELIRPDSTSKVEDFGKLLKGEVRTISAQEIKKQLLFTHGRIICSEYFIENDLDQVVKILAELEEYDLAIDLAIESQDPNVSVAYPISVMLEKVSAKNENEMKDVSNEEEEEASILEQETLEKFRKNIMPRLNTTQLIETASCLSSQNIEIPEFLESELVKQGQVQFLLQYYLSEENVSIEKALDLFIREEGERKLVRQLTDIEMPLLVLFIEMIKLSLNDNKQALNQWKESEKERIEFLHSQGLGIQDVRCSEDFKADLLEFYQCDQTVQVHDELVRRDEERDGNDKELDQIRQNIKEIQKLIEKLEESQVKIRAAMKSALNA